MYIITNIQEASPLLKGLIEVKEIGLDTETTTLDPYTAQLLLIQLNVNNEIYLLDVRKLGKTIKYIVSILKDSNVCVIGHNLKFDVKMIYHATKELLSNCYDTMLAEMIINAGLVGKFPSYAELVDKYCSVVLEKEVRKSFINYEGELTNDQLIYSALDVKYLFDIKNKQLKQLEELKLTRISDLENGLVPVFSKMEYDGIELDIDKWLANAKFEERRVEELKEKLLDYIIKNVVDVANFENAFVAAQGLSIPVGTKKLREELNSLNKEFSHRWVRENFNIKSTYQMRAVLRFLGINVPDTNEDTIRKYKEHEIIKILLEYREAEKRVSTYGESFLKNINPVTGYIHTEWDQLKSTGRIGSSNPNLQNQPREQSFRECYVARAGKLLLTADYSQAELRLLGSVSGEPVFILAYKKGEDIHKQTATLLFDKSIDEITKDERYKGKTLNFSLVYGISEYGLWKKNDIPMEEGKELIKKYFEKLEYIKEFIRLSGDSAVARKYATTPYGRKRFFKNKILFESSSDEWKYIASMRREGTNTIIQGGIADAIKIAMLKMFRDNPFGESFKLLLQVHDELVIEIDKDIKEDATKFVNKYMVDALQPFLGEIPAVVDIHIDTCWIKD